MYNSMTALPIIPYKIMEYLITDEQAEPLWQMLAHNSYDALSKPKLTAKQKMDLLWKTGPQEKFGIFLAPLIEDAIAESKSIMKVYQYYIHASELYTGTVVYSFDFLYGGQMALVDYNGIPVSRGDLFINTILKCLNGKEVNGVGKLTFLTDMSRYDLAKSVIGNSKTFTGVQLYMSTIVGDSGVQATCVG